MTTVQNKDFRHWCWETWRAHCDEVHNWTGEYPAYSARDYFTSYRWWLRTLYRHQ